MVRDWDYDETDYLRLMKAYLEGRIGVEAFSRQLWGMNGKRSLMTEAASEIICRALGETDRFDPVLREPEYIEEPSLREFISRSVKQLEALGNRLDDQK